MEHVFGSLKNHFGILKCDSYFSFQTQVDIILIYCILHNWIIIEGGDDFIHQKDEWARRRDVSKSEKGFSDDSQEWLEERD